MSNDTNQPEEETEQQIELLDCGQASKKTQGLPILLSFEVGWPPFDRTLFG